jgi:hypothetical protein
MSMGVGPPGPPNGTPQGAAPGETPQTLRKKKGIGAGFYRIKTGLIRAVAGPEKKKTEKKSKKEKTGQTPSPVRSNTNAPGAAVQTPLTSDDQNYFAYMHDQQPATPPPVQKMQIDTAPQNPFSMSQPPAPAAPALQATTLSASVPPKKTTDDWEGRITSAIGTVIENLAYGKETFLAFDDLRMIAKEKKHWDSKNLTRWVRDLTAGCTFEEFVSIQKNAATLPDTYLGNSFRREIARIVVPRQFIRTIVDAGDVKDLDRALASCCRPYNEEYKGRPGIASWGRCFRRCSRKRSNANC